MKRTTDVEIIPPGKSRYDKPLVTKAEITESKYLDQSPVPVERLPVVQKNNSFKILMGFIGAGIIFGTVLMVLMFPSSPATIFVGAVFGGACGIVLYSNLMARR